jgi:hypothetical protein
MSATASLGLKKRLVLDGRENREQIIVTASDSIKYIASSFPGADPTEAMWLCQRIESTGTDFPYTQIVQTYPIGAEPELAVPGTDGAGLAALFGD